MKFLMIIILFLSACMPQSNSNNSDMNTESDLIIKIKANTTISVAYAHAYKCELVEVIKGQLDMDIILITVLANDKENFDYFSKNLFPKVLELEFNKKNKNENYGIMPITGFVDKNRTSWELTSVKLNH